MDRGHIAWHCEQVRHPAPFLPIKMEPLWAGHSVSGRVWLFRFDNNHGAHVSSKSVVSAVYNVVHCVYPGPGPQWHCINPTSHELDIVGVVDMLEAIKEGRWTSS